MIDDTIISPIADNPVVDQQEVSVSDQQESPQPRQSGEETAQQKNFKMMREKAERAERERDDAIRKLREIEAAKSQAQVQQEDEFQIGPDELAEGKHLSKVVQKMKRIEGELNEYKRKSSVETTEARIKAEYPDFDKVVSRDNIEVLKNNYPELAHTLNASQDMYVTAKAAYTLIRKLGISPDTTSYDADKELAQRNSAKPRPLASVSPQQGDSALSRANAFANGLTDELKEQLRKEMSAARRAY